MAKLTPIILTILFLSSSTFIIPTKSQDFSRKLSSKSELGLKKEKLSHLHFYWRQTESGPNATAVHVAEAATTNSSATAFGTVVVFDNPLMLKPENGSKIVGRAQGLFALVDLQKFGFLMAMSFEFTEGKFNGSTLSVLGRNDPLAALREMPIAGGTGVFRFARGYAQAKTYDSNPQTGIVIEYNVYVSHH